MRFFGPDKDEDGELQRSSAMAQLREEFVTEKARTAAEAARDASTAEAAVAQTGKEKAKKCENEQVKAEAKDNAVKAAPKPAAKDGKDSKEENKMDADKECHVKRKQPESFSGPGSGSRSGDDGSASKKQRVVAGLRDIQLKKFADVPGEIKDEISQYMSLPAVSVDADPLSWWRQHKAMFPILSRLARKFLAIPATSAPCERVWSTAGNVVTKRRARLTDEHVDCLVFLHENFDLCLAAATEFCMKL